MGSSNLSFLAAVTVAVSVGQILSAGLMARRIPLSWKESWTVGIGMCGRAEMAFVLAAIGLKIGAIDAQVFSVLIMSAFALNVLTSFGLWLVAQQLPNQTPQPPQT